ncbi:PREDICTED: sphingosine-1-phosphate lyase isoform X3 [Camelina sativa]|uniref:sphinganine-1-phosphate aldolase n=1 Tax=Camelina sativa TaxID=90675 RepID=A0ABM0YDD7_CAMSA|nr:PREDICTED: sphingosine-1-phosphate lyase isoform X2 [Camelina sativa]XP_010499294.1 PREDICTED: sphingosine-1-phosphate lyase isoform X1 [Camelina sativa]XP_010499295.1 PREDICTED: sphingosine-1-phosphate lyase isoform X3 [Camelina sativa]
MDYFSYSSMKSMVIQARGSLNSRLSEFEPLFLLLAPLLTLFFAQIIGSVLGVVNDKGLKACLVGFIMGFLKMIPGVQNYIDAEKQKVVDQLQSGSSSKKKNRAETLPVKGLGVEVLEKMETEKRNDAIWQGKCSGTVYIGGGESEGHFALINQACSMFAHTNPLHIDVFQSVVRFESEVVAMTAALLGSKETVSGEQICGNMTSGGTESIVLAVKSSRDYMKYKKGITRPEMIIPESGHSAYDKAAQYFNIKLWRVPVDKEFRADVKAIRRHINRNTIMIVGSAPGFPHGIIDPIEELGQLALSYGICFHVDLCLGGFVLPFARKLGYQIPAFDFSVQGVTSISVDVHKYGLAPKGTSTVLYRNHEIRKHQFVAVTEWSGGLYVSPTIAGSRPGSLVAGAWAAMMSLGEEGYLQNTSKIMEASKRLEEGVREIHELFVIGKPDMTIVAFGSKELDIFEVNDIMSSKGWHLNALQRPNSIHICITLQHVPVVDDFLQDLRGAVETVKANPGPITGGLAPIYGAAGKMPDRGMVNELLVSFMDSQY